MKKSNLTSRKLRTRLLIQVGGLALKSGLLDRLNIPIGADLQDHENLVKASQLMGFLLEHSEDKEFTESQLTQWQRRGERAIRYE